MAETMKLLSKGAEAHLYLGEFLGYRAVFKRRIRKPYRDSKFDRKIRIKRTLNEARLLNAAAMAGINVPALFDINLNTTTIVLEFIDGILLKDYIMNAGTENSLRILYEVGLIVGRLHRSGIIHGDLTTSNMILSSSSGRIYLIDFGLGEKSWELENRGVDLHLLLRALESTHYDIAEMGFKEVLRGYSDVMGINEALKVRSKIDEIRSRGRYVVKRIRH